MDCQRANLVGIVTDECAESPRLDRLLDCLAARLAASAAAGYQAPDTFLGVAGRKIFRDEIWANLRDAAPWYSARGPDHCGGSPPKNTS